jgi:predicted  nucleic acid-binding Zn-ribbon protein
VGDGLRETLANLLALQAIDDEAREYLKERDALQESLARLKELLTLMTNGVEEKKAKLAEASKWYRAKDAELKADQEKVQKAKQKLQTVTKNKEYMAMQKEIESLRKANQLKEEEILKLLEATEEFKQAIATEREKIEDLSGEVRREEEANASRLEELEMKISAITKRRDEVAKRLKPSLVSRYKRIHSAREGLAVVRVENQVCSGCNQLLTAQQYQRLQRGATLEMCQKCNRYLYMDELVAGSDAGAHVEA